MSRNSSVGESTAWRVVRNPQQQQLTSRVWDYFDLLQRPSSSMPGSEYKAVCKKCGKMLSYDPSHGTTTHLLRHVERIICTRTAAARQQQAVVAAPATNDSLDDDSAAAAEAFADGVWAADEDAHDE